MRDSLRLVVELALSCLREAVASDGVVLGIQLNPKILATESAGSKKGRTGTSEGIQRHSIRWREGGNQRREDAERLFRRVVLVAAIAPVQYIANDVFGRGVALRQQVGGFVLVGHMPGFGRVAFGEDEVTHDAEASFMEGG